MRDQSKTKQELTGEVMSLRQRIAELEQVDSENKRVEQTLRESDRKYRELVETANSIILRWSRDGRITFMNEFGQQFFGYTEAEILGRHMVGTIVPETESTGRDLGPLMDKIYANPKDFEKNINENMRHNGERVWISWTNKTVLDGQGQVLEVLSIGSDITDRKRADEALRENEQRLASIYRTVADPIFHLAVEPAGQFRIIAVNPAFLKTTGLSHEMVVGRTMNEIVPESSLAMVLGKYRQAIEENTIVCWEETSDYPAGRLVGEVSIAPVFNDKGICTHLVGSVNDITELKQAEERLKETLKNLRRAVGTTIQVMVSAVEARDPYTAGHQLRVADLACAIATRMGVSEDRIEGIHLAGCIHDIGKLSIPAEILSKPAKLSENEFSLIKEHARKGHEILKNVESSWPLAEIVYQHHERMDGSGYPRNLQGDDILMEARIMTVADVVEAMASHRPYRAGLGIDAALNEIEKNSGICYDKAVADACLGLFREKGFQLVA